MHSRPLRLLFQGDSITEAFRRPEELNPAYQLGNGYVLLIASVLASEFPSRFEFVNRGISGHTVADLSLRWNQDALALAPDSLSLLVGVNSTIRAMIGEEDVSLAEFQKGYRNLLQRVLEANPATLLILVEPFLLVAGDVNEKWRKHLSARREVVRHLAQEFQAVFVASQKAFDEAAARAPGSFWAYDGIHPTHAGAAVLAQAWLDAARPTLEGFFIRER